MNTLAVAQGTLTFVPTTQVYWVQIPFDYSSTTVSGTLQDAVTASVVWNPASRTVSGLIYPNWVDVTGTVTAQDGGVRLYTVHIQRAPSYVALLASYTPDYGSLVPMFDPNIFAYSLSIPNSVKQITMTSTFLDNTAHIVSWSPSQTVGPTLVVIPGTTSVRVNTLAEDGVTTAAYTVTISRARSSQDLLASLSSTCLSTARMFPSFDSGTTAYSMSGYLGPAVTFFTVNAIPMEPTQTLQWKMDSLAPVALAQGVDTIIPITVGDHIISIISTSEDYVHIMTYTITFHQVSPVSTLAALAPSLGALTPAFSSGTYSGYTLNIPAATSSVSFTFTPTSAFATGSFTFGSSSEVTYTNAVATSAQTLPSSGDSTLQVKVRSEDLTTTTTYTVIVHRLSAVATLQAISSPQGQFDRAYSLSDTSPYVLGVSAATDSLQLIARPTNIYATVAVKVGGGAYLGIASGSTVTVVASALAVGDTTILVRVTSEDGAAQTVTTLTVHRLSAVATLGSISVPPTSVTPTFSSGTTSYTAVYTASSGVINVGLTPTYSLASISYSWQGGSSVYLPPTTSITGLNPNFGDNPLVVWVTAEDGSATTKYSFNLHRNSNDASLAGLSVIDSSALTQQTTPGFLSAGSSYSVSIPAATGQVSLIALSSNQYAVRSYASSSTLIAASSASYTAFGAGVSQSPLISIPVGNSWLFVRVVSEDGTATTYYTLSLLRLSNVATLAALSFTPSGSGLSPVFDSATNSYAFNLPAATTQVSTSFTLPALFASATYHWNSEAVATVPGTGVSRGLSNLQLHSGANVLTLSVQSEDATQTVVYTITITRLSADTTLAVLKLQDGTTEPGFDPVQLSYNAAVSKAVTSTTLFASATVSTANVDYSSTAPHGLPSLRPLVLFPSR
jgi:hypothetical protein